MKMTGGQKQRLTRAGDPAGSTGQELASSYGQAEELRSTLTRVLADAEVFGGRDVGQSAVIPSQLTF